MIEKAIEIQDLVFKRGDRSVINGLTISVQKNKLTALMGPSGVGKTTMLKLITGQECPVSGTVRVFGEDVHKMSRKALYFLRSKIGVLFQSSALLTDLRVFDNVALPLRMNTKLDKKQIYDMVCIKLEAVGLLGAMELFPNELSGGMARRASIARSLALDPEIIMYDEPFTGQDPITMGVLVKLIGDVSKSMVITSLAISHDVNEILSIADYAYLLSQGKSVGSGTPEQLFKDKSPYISQFLKGVEDGPVPFHFSNNQPLKERLFA